MILFGLEFDRADSHPSEGTMVHVKIGHHPRDQPRPTSMSNEDGAAVAMGPAAEPDRALQPEIGIGIGIGLGMNIPCGRSRIRSADAGRSGSTVGIATGQRVLIARPSTIISRVDDPALLLRKQEIGGRQQVLVRPN